MGNFATSMQEYLEGYWQENWESENRIKRWKARGAAFLCGVIDGAVIAYPFMLIAIWCLNIEVIKLRKNNK